MKKNSTKDQALLDAISELYPDSSRRTLRNWIEGGHVTINGKMFKRANQLVKKGDEVVVADQKTKPHKIEGILVLYEDSDLIILNKPSGLLSVPLDKPGSRSALGILRNHFGSDAIYPVHRIDKETSGSLLFAKNPETRAGLIDLFSNHDLIREYLAIVEGNIDEERGTWKCKLEENEATYDVDLARNPDKGKLAITHYEIVNKTVRNTLLLLRLETGKKHQIRVQSKLAGHPVLGDKRYGSKTDPYQRLCLHAHRICFKHPMTGETIDITAPYPHFWKRVLTR